ncbi:hypothetical protein ACU8KH_03720 [Lachancea thermotolerans]
MVWRTSASRRPIFLAFCCLLSTSRLCPKPCRGGRTRFAVRDIVAGVHFTIGPEKYQDHIARDLRECDGLKTRRKQLQKPSFQ